MIRLLVLAPVLALAACVEVPPPVVTFPNEPETIDACKASSWQGLVGQPRSVLNSMLLPAGARVIGPEDAVTMDFRADRLNIEIGATGRIERVACY